MDADWSEVNQIAVPPAFLSDLPRPASAFDFDTHSELLWAGNEYGRVCSFYGPELRQYTSFKAHGPQDEPVNQLLFHERGVISLAAHSVHFASRKGPALWHIAENDMQDLQCMSFLGHDGLLLAGGRQSVMFKIDVDKGQIIERISTEHQYTLMKFCKYLCAATATGTIDVLDPIDLQIVNTFTTNNASVNDMDAQNHYLVACGWANRPQGQPMLSSLANVYDLKSMKQLTPVGFHAGAAYVKMHPKMSTTCFLASQNGQLQVLDLMNPGATHLKQINISNYMSGLILAPSGEALAVCDSDGLIHLWGSPTGVRFTEFGAQMPEFGDNPERLPFMDVDSDAPLSNIAMPYYREQLLSAWSNIEVYDVSSAPPKIDPAILGNAGRHARGGIGIWVPNTRQLRRNQADTASVAKPAESGIGVPKFLSEKARESDYNGSSAMEVMDIQKALNETSLTTKKHAPTMYRKVDIKYSRFGVEDFDFRYYNQTLFSGLETDIENSYTNALLQLIRFTPVLRNLALQHTATTCLAENCLLCEMGFLFDTMEKADGVNCQASNFLKAFSSTPQAGRMGLLEDKYQNNSLTEMLQQACRFLLPHAAEEFRRIVPTDLAFEQAIAIDAVTSIRCNSCHSETARPGGSYLTDLSYQIGGQTPRVRQQQPTFSQVLKASIEAQNEARGYCDKCRRYPMLASRRVVRTLPDVLLINSALKSEDARLYWDVPGWLPDKIGIFLEGGKFFCFEGEDLRLHLEKGMHDFRLYDLVGVVADIHDGQHQKSHLVSMIDVAVSQREPTEAASWHLFNDFLVCPISEEEALNFSPAWKSPSVFAFQSASLRHGVDDGWKASLDISLLYQNWSINNKQPEDTTLLSYGKDTLEAGTHIAIDTEFVMLQQDEIEMRADGVSEVVRPKRDGLARVSVLRGGGEDEGTAFINDYITMQEEIVDYLTKWSGIMVGDLDPAISPHNLVPLKAAYKKVWLLVNLGCVFIGHGLAKDFRIMNIHVPKAQVVDTVFLFYRGQRKLSLRFLAWCLLGEKVQTDNHDSIEDARTALRLWRRYEELRECGEVESTISRIYQDGKKWNFKPPGEAAATLTGGLGRRMGSKSNDSNSLGLPGGSGEGRETPDMMLDSSAPGTPGDRRAGPGRGLEYFDGPSQ